MGLKISGFYKFTLSALIALSLLQISCIDEERKKKGSSSVSQSLSDIIISDLMTNLNLSTQDAAALQESIKQSLASSNLSSSSDLNSILPAIAGAAEDKLKDLSFTSSADRETAVKKIGKTLIKSLKGRESHLSHDSQSDGMSAHEAVVHDISAAMIKHLGNSGFNSN
jgi:hypothetical protein